MIAEWVELLYSRPPLHCKKSFNPCERKRERARERHGIVVDITKWYAFVTGQHEDDFLHSFFYSKHTKKTISSLGRAPNCSELSALIIHSWHIHELFHERDQSRNWRLSFGAYYCWGNSYSFRLSVLVGNKATQNITNDFLQWSFGALRGERRGEGNILRIIVFY